MNIYTISVLLGEYDNIPKMVRFFVPRGITYDKLRAALAHQIHTASLLRYRHRADLFEAIMEATARQCYGRAEIITPEEEFDFSSVGIGGRSAWW